MSHPGSVRPVKRERKLASLFARFQPRPAFRSTGGDCSVTTLPWPAVVEGAPDERPLALGCPHSPDTVTSTLFLAETDSESHPNNEVFGLVKLTREKVIEVAHNPGTFSAIQSEAEPQRSDPRVIEDKPIVVSTHFRALAYCLEMGYV